MLYFDQTLEQLVVLTKHGTQWGVPLTVGGSVSIAEAVTAISNAHLGLPSRCAESSGPRAAFVPLAVQLCNAIKV